MKVQHIQPSENIRDLLAIEKLSAIGDPALIQKTHFALFCSVKCPASIILKMYDLAQKLKDKGIGVISGFHAPVEKEALVTLLRGDAPIVICPARSIENMRVPVEWKLHIEQQRILILSPFSENQTRATQEAAAIRNQLVAALAQQVFIAYAEPGGKTEAFALELITRGKSVTTFDTKEADNLLASGAKPLAL